MNNIYLTQISSTDNLVHLAGLGDALTNFRNITQICMYGNELTFVSVYCVAHGWHHAILPVTQGPVIPSPLLLSPVRLIKFC